MQLGANNTDTNIAGDRNLIDLPVEIPLQIRRGFLELHVPGASGLNVALLTRIQRILKGQHIIHCLGIDVVDAYAVDSSKIAVLLEAVLESVWKLAYVLCRYHTGAVIALGISGSTGAGNTTTVEYHVGSLPAHQAAIRITSAVACINRSHQIEVGIARGADAIAETKIKLEAVIEVVMTISTNDVHAGLALMIALARHRLEDVIGRLG